jgi:hypothetical protein
MTTMNMTEKEEQEMIERAKAGDPKANYDMALWALEQAMAEPEEERWNQLAAKCLVKAAQAGYEPAKVQMAQFMEAVHAEQKAQVSDTPEAPEPDEAEPDAQSDTQPDAAAEGTEEFDWSARPQERQPQEQPSAALRAVAVAGMAARAIGAGAKTVYKKGRGLIAQLTDTKDEEDDDDGEYADETADAGAENSPAAPAAKHATKKKFALPDFSQWDDGKWKKMQVICIVLCVVLALLIVLMVRSGHKDTDQEDTSQLPPAATTEPATPAPTEEPITYPDADIRAEIKEATLDIYPDDDDYVEEETTATVTPGAGLNLRKGPGSSYSQIVLMSYNSELQVYAYKNGWALVKYQDSTWGWCSDDYIKVQ